MDVVGSEGAALLYVRTEDRRLRLHRRRMLRRLVLEESLLLTIVVLFEIFPSIYYRAISWTPLPSRLMYYCLVGLWVPLGLYVGISRYWSSTVPPRITTEALVLFGHRTFPLVDVREMRLSIGKETLTLEMDSKMSKGPKRMVLRLGGILVPDGDRFMLILKSAWDSARARHANR